MKRKTYCVYNGLNIEAIKHEAMVLAKEKGCEGADVVCVGRLVEIKKQDVLVEAISILAKQGLNLDLILVGGPVEDSNPYYQKLKEQAVACGLSDHVRLTGYVEKPYGILVRSEASVLCCSREGFGNVVVEAMACGTPVIVADAGGPSEFVVHDENGLKFTPDNAKELAECLRSVLTDEALRKRLVKKASALVNEKFTCEAHMTQLRQRFEQLIRDSR